MLKNQILTVAELISKTKIENGEKYLLANLLEKFYTGLSSRMDKMIIKKAITNFKKLNGMLDIGVYKKK